MDASASNLTLSDPSLWVAFAALIVAAGGPCLTALIQCWHESRMYKKKFVKEHAHEAIERYLKSVGKCLFSIEIKDFGEASAEIFMYAPKELWPDIKQLNEHIAKLNHESDSYIRAQLRSDSEKLYFSLCEKFSPLSRSSKYKNKRKHRKDN